MKKIFVKITALCCFIVLAGACQSKKELLLKAPSDKKVYSIKVEDATEIDLLRQQLHLNIVKVGVQEVYFQTDNEAVLKQLSDMGYGTAQSQSPDEMAYLLAKR